MDSGIKEKGELKDTVINTYNVMNEGVSNSVCLSCMGGTRKLTAEAYYSVY